MVELDTKKYVYNPKTEGKEPFQKLIGLGKYASYGTMLTFAYEASFLKKRTVLMTAFLAGKHSLFWLGASATFTTTVLCLTNIRKKDDPWNYYLGTLASGGYAYSFLGKGRLVFIVTMYTAIGATLLKYYLMKDNHPLRDGFTFRSNMHYLNFDNTPDIRY